MAADRLLAEFGGDLGQGIAELRDVTPPPCGGIRVHPHVAQVERPGLASLDRALSSTAAEMNLPGDVAPAARDGDLAGAVDHGRIAEDACRIAVDADGERGVKAPALLLAVTSSCGASSPTATAAAPPTASVAVKALAEGRWRRISNEAPVAVAPEARRRMRR